MRGGMWVGQAPPRLQLGCKRREAARSGCVRAFPLAARILWVCDGTAAPALCSGWAVRGCSGARVVAGDGLVAGADAGAVFARVNLSPAFF